jgi:hypothetical protein
MKIPLGLLLGNQGLAENKVLIAPVEIHPHLKLSAGTVLYTRDGGPMQPIEKIKQTLDKLTERAQKANDSKVFMDAMGTMDKEKMVYLNNKLELVEQDVLMVNVAYSDDLTPDGRLFKILSTLYPRYYPKPDSLMKFTDIVKELETRKLQILNDISLPYNETLLVEYKTILDRTKYINIREKLGKLALPVKKQDLFDATSDGRFVISRPLFSYTKKFLYPENTEVTDVIMGNRLVQEFLNGDPLIACRRPDSRDGIYLADNDPNFLDIFKGWLKRNFFKMIGETMNKNEVIRVVQQQRPKYVFLGNLGSDTEQDFTTIEALQKAGAATGLDSNALNIFILLSTKNPGLESNLRNKGLTFIFYKDEIAADVESFGERLKGTFGLFEQTL